MDHKALLVLIALLCGAMLASCETPPAETAADADRALAEAQELIEQTTEFVDEARAKLPDAATVAEAAIEAEEAYEAERYSDAVAALRRAVDALTAAGVDVPPEVPGALGRAQGLLMVVGK